MKLLTRTLSNGLRLQAVPMPGTNVITTLVLVGAGSRYETQDIRGISHFLEHMFFKGAKKYTTPKEVSQAVDRFGGEFNAFTGKEYAGYYVKASASNVEKAVDVLSDMLLHSRFEPEEINKERGVILEEMAMYLDAPMYQISWDFEQLVFGDQPLGWDQIGTKELIKTVTQDQFKSYQQELYTPDNTVITVAGAVDESTLDLLESAFTFGEQTQSRHFHAYAKPADAKKLHHRVKKTEQYHLSFGVEALPAQHEDFATLKVMATILGGNMSSRMFQNVREAKGLCYSIRTQIEDFTDAGILTTRAGVRLSDLPLALSAIREEYEVLVTTPVTEEEVRDAVNYLSGKLDLQTEDTEDVAHHFAKNTLLHHTVETFEDWKQTLARVTAEDVQALAAQLFHPDNYRLALIGPRTDELGIEALLS